MELVSTLSDFLQKKYNRNSEFWNTKTVDELVQEQKIEVTNNIAVLGVDFWPDEESVDEFNEFIQQQRQRDRLGE